MRVCTIGTGYVGLSTAICLAHLGHQVRGFDVDKKKIALLKSGVLPIYEPGLLELLELNKRNINFVDDPVRALRDVEVVFITVGTPSRADGRARFRLPLHSSRWDSVLACRILIAFILSSTASPGLPG